MLFVSLYNLYVFAEDDEAISCSFVSWCDIKHLLKHIMKQKHPEEIRNLKYWPFLSQALGIEHPKIEADFQ